MMRCGAVVAKQGSMVGQLRTKLNFQQHALNLTQALLEVVG